MKVTPSKKIIPEEYPGEDRELAKRISQVINPFLDQISQALNNALSLRDNLKCKVIPVTLDVNVSTAKLPWDVNEKPTAVLVGQITKGNNKENITAGYSLCWQYIEGKIEISLIGLAASVKHDISIIAIV